VSIPIAMRAGGRRYCASLEVVEAVGHWVAGGRIAFVRRRSSFPRRHLGDFNVAMWRLCHCPSGFLRICNVAVRGGAATLKTWRLCLRLTGFRHIVTSNGW
jgi:hypothetical protein